MSLEPQGDEVEQISQEKEVVGDELEGGLADDKTAAEFDPEQIAKGIKVEMEHTKDPMVALEIAMDHLTEISDYYDRLEQMEADAEGNGAGSTDPTNPSGCLPDGMFMDKKDDDSGDEEMTDRLLGYQPKNVGDEMGGEEEPAETVPTSMEGEPEEKEEEPEEKPEEPAEEPEEKKEISEAQLKIARLTLSNRKVPTGMSKKEAVQILIKNNTKQIL
jgi:hypothetical protein